MRRAISGFGHVEKRGTPTMLRGIVKGGIFIFLLASSMARADCALGETYKAGALGNAVLVCINGVGSSATPLLRQGAAGGAVVQIAGSCVPYLADGGAASNFGGDGGAVQFIDDPEDACCYIDDCVSPGSYRYGLATPISCPNGCGGVAPYWVSATVTSDLDGGCNGTSPTPYANGAPWPSNGEQTQQCGGCGCSVASSVLGFDSLVLALSMALLHRRRRRGLMPR
jgi:hypothetical protein